MKNAFVHRFLPGLMFLSLISPVSGQTGKTEKAIEPTAKEAIKLIFSNGDIPLASDATCKTVGTSAEDKTILDYLSGVLSFQTTPGSENRIGTKFTKEKGKNNQIIWVCDLMFYGKDAEDVWSNGVRFKILNSNRKLMRDSVICIGTG